MENIEFKILLKEAKITKKEFSELFGMHYTTVRNWGSVSEFPSWVKFSLQNYIKAKKYDELMNEKNSEL